MTRIFGALRTAGRSTVTGRRCRTFQPSPEDSIAMSKDMKKRGMGFVGPVITYSFLQSIGIVNDHLDDCEYR